MIIPDGDVLVKLFLVSSITIRFGAEPPLNADNIICSIEFRRELRQYLAVELHELM